MIGAALAASAIRRSGRLAIGRSWVAFLYTGEDVRTLQQSLTEALVNMESTEQAGSIAAVASLFRGVPDSRQDWSETLASPTLSRELPIKPSYQIQ